MRDKRFEHRYLTLKLADVKNTLPATSKSSLKTLQTQSLTVETLTGNSRLKGSSLNVTGPSTNQRPLCCIIALVGRTFIKVIPTLRI